jgi:hypothetical protein
MTKYLFSSQNQDLQVLLWDSIYNGLPSSSPKSEIILHRNSASSHTAQQIRHFMDASGAK